MFFAQVGMLGVRPQVRRFVPDLMDLVLTRKINSDKVFRLKSPVWQRCSWGRAADLLPAVSSSWMVV